MHTGRWVAAGMMTILLFGGFQASGFVTMDGESVEGQEPVLAPQGAAGYTVNGRAVDFWYDPLAPSNPVAAAQHYIDMEYQGFFPVYVPFWYDWEQNVIVIRDFTEADVQNVQDALLEMGVWVDPLVPQQTLHEAVDPARELVRRDFDLLLSAEEFPAAAAPLGDATLWVMKPVGHLVTANKDVLILLNEVVHQDTGALEETWTEDGYGLHEFQDVPAVIGGRYIAEVDGLSKDLRLVVPGDVIHPVPCEATAVLANDCQDMACTWEEAGCCVGDGPQLEQCCEAIWPYGSKITICDELDELPPCDQPRLLVVADICATTVPSPCHLILDAGLTFYVEGQDWKDICDPSLPACDTIPYFGIEGLLCDHEIPDPPPVDCESISIGAQIPVDACDPQVPDCQDLYILNLLGDVCGLDPDPCAWRSIGLQAAYDPCQTPENPCDDGARSMSTVCDPPVQCEEPCIEPDQDCDRFVEPLYSLCSGQIPVGCDGEPIEPIGMCEPYQIPDPPGACDVSAVPMICEPEPPDEPGDPQPTGPGTACHATMGGTLTRRTDLERHNGTRPIIERGAGHRIPQMTNHVHHVGHNLQHDWYYVERDAYCNLIDEELRRFVAGVEFHSDDRVQGVTQASMQFVLAYNGGWARDDFNFEGWMYPVFGYNLQMAGSPSSGQTWTDIQDITVYDVDIDSTASGAESCSSTFDWGAAAKYGITMLTTLSTGPVGGAAAAVTWGARLVTSGQYLHDRVSDSGYDGDEEGCSNHAMDIDSWTTNYDPESGWVTVLIDADTDTLYAHRQEPRMLVGEFEFELDGVSQGGPDLVLRAAGGALYGLEGWSWQDCGPTSCSPHGPNRARLQLGPIALIGATEMQFDQ